MASGIYNKFKYSLMRGFIDLVTETINCVLLNNTYSFSADESTYANVSGKEVAGTGYVTGGQALTSKTVTKDDSNDRAAWDTADVTWASSTITARYAVLYDVDTSSNDLICCFDFGQDYSSSSGNFTLQWNANGIILLT